MPCIVKPELDLHIDLMSRMSCIISVFALLSVIEKKKKTEFSTLERGCVPPKACRPGWTGKELALRGM